MLRVTTPLSKYLCYVGVLMLMNICNRSFFKAMGLIHLTLYQHFYYLPRTDVRAHVQKKTILLCLWVCDPGIDITDVYCVAVHPLA